VIAVINGIGWVTAAGMGCGKDHDSFAMPNARLAAVERKSVFDQPYRNFGRMDEFSRLGLAAIAFALRDADLEQWHTKRDIGMIAATEYGCLWTDIDYYETVLPEGGTLASPYLFAYTLPNCFLGEAAIRFGLTGESFVVNEPAAAGLVSMQLALGSMAAKESEKMICGVCDLGRPSQFGGTNDVAPGALFFVLETAADAKRRTYGELDLNTDGGIRFNRNNINNLVELVQACLQANRTF
jgi:3-oxoacyl-[acyl-carrier-protein] synthase II